MPAPIKKELNPTPLHLQHDTFEQEVAAGLEDMGFYCHSQTYHNSMPPELSKVLANRWSPTALYLRGRADRTAIHRTAPFEFEFECKTHDSAKWHDMTLELGPLCFHKMKARHGVDCLYIYRHNGNECGFWIDEIPQPRVIFIPNKWTDEGITYYSKLAAEYFPNVGIVTPTRVNGSGDPFVIIDSAEVAKLHGWRDLVAVRMSR